MAEEPKKKRLKGGVGEETNLCCPSPQCEGVLRWKPDGRQPNYFFLGCSNYRVNQCKAKGCSGKSFEGGSEVEISDDEEQLAATKASADEAIKLAAKSKGIAEGDPAFLMNLIKASASVILCILLVWCLQFP